jgi:hypothetical protein
LAGQYLGEIWKYIPNGKLSTVYRYVTGKELDPEKLHDGYYDITLTVEVYLILWNKGYRPAVLTSFGDISKIINEKQKYDAENKLAKAEKKNRQPVDDITFNQ